MLRSNRLCHAVQVLAFAWPQALMAALSEEIISRYA